MGRLLILILLMRTRNMTDLHGRSITVVYWNVLGFAGTLDTLAGNTRIQTAQTDIAATAII